MFVAPQPRVLKYWFFFAKYEQSKHQLWIIFGAKAHFFAELFSVNVWRHNINYEVKKRRWRCIVHVLRWIHLPSPESPYTGKRSIGRPKETWRCIVEKQTTSPEASWQRRQSAGSSDWLWLLPYAPEGTRRIEWVCMAAPCCWTSARPSTWPP